MIEEHRQTSQNQQIVNSILKIALEDISLDEILQRALGYVLLLEYPESSWTKARCSWSTMIPIIFSSGRTRDLIGITLRPAAESLSAPVIAAGAALTGDIQFSECVNHGHDIRLADMAPHGHDCVPRSCSGENLLGVLSLVSAGRPCAER